MRCRLLISSLLMVLAVAACARPDIAVRQNVQERPAPPVSVDPDYARQPEMAVVADSAQLPADAGAFAKCAVCHSLEPGRHGIGPSLAGVYGRAAARDGTFRYSEALSTSGLVWDAATLDQFLTSPRDAVPGIKMTFAGLKDPAQRAQIIAFIERY